ncbi:MAG: aminotransferase class I/II-fold pyridoxal phosphate-dependent enzyme [Candidatus Gastranaerophilales bacterium]|nr:aminotransferase class I/II-fold pyridoxal phosphate-dependent enzyme [Candidatus Gastranaerophilales bacterium]
MIKPRKALENISPYNTDFYRENWRLKLDANENIYGCANNILSAIKNINSEDVSLYPCYGKLLDKISAKFSLNNNNILFSNGADEALNILINTYLEQEEELLSFKPTFSMPTLYAKALGAKTRYIDYDEKYIFSKSKLKENINNSTKLIYIATPNNPTGEVVKASIIESLLNEYKDVLFIIDCTYINFSFNVAFEDYIDLAKKYNNIAIVKSYSKDFAIAGLRFGLTIANESIISNLKKVISPYSVNMIAINCAMMIISDDKRIEEIKELNHSAKELLEKELIKAELIPYPSEANFILCDFKNYCNFYYQKFKNNGIITRKFSDSSLSDCLRITIPTLGGVKFISELLIKKDVLVFDFEGVIFNSEELLIPKETFEELSKKYDLVIYSNTKEEIAVDLLKKFEIEKYFNLICYFDPQSENDSMPDAKGVLNLINNTPNKSIKFFSANLKNIICANIAQINTIGVISPNMDSQSAINNYRHLGTGHILHEIKNLEYLLEGIEKECKEQ